MMALPLESELSFPWLREVRGIVGVFGQGLNKKHFISLFFTAGAGGWEPGAFFVFFHDRKRKEKSTAVLGTERCGFHPQRFFRWNGALNGVPAVPPRP
jgi:hypothetical protein